MQLRSLSVHFAARLFDKSAEPITATEIEHLSPGLRTLVRMSGKARPVTIVRKPKGKRVATTTVITVGRR